MYEHPQWSSMGVDPEVLEGSLSLDYGSNLPQEVLPQYRSAIMELDEGLKAIDSLKGLEGLKDLDLDRMMDVLWDRRHSINRRAKNYIPMCKSLVAPIPAPVDRSSIKGILAFREWNMSTSSILKPLFHSSVDWEEVMFSDKVPEKVNSNGLYARSLLPDIISTGSIWCGLVELLGHVEEHSDGVYRAEVAKIKAIYCTVIMDTHNATLVFGTLEGIKDKYPLTPVYVVTEYQKRIILMREVLISLGIRTI